MLGWELLHRPCEESARRPRVPSPCSIPFFPPCCVNSSIHVSNSIRSSWCRCENSCDTSLPCTHSYLKTHPPPLPALRTPCASRRLSVAVPSDSTCRGFRGVGCHPTHCSWHTWPRVCARAQWCVLHCIAAVVLDVVDVLVRLPFLPDVYAFVEALPNLYVC